VQAVEFAVRHEGGDLLSGLNAAEGVMRAPQEENGLADRDQLFGGDPVTRLRAAQAG